MRTRIAPQTGAFLELRRGERLRVTDPEGRQVSDLFCFDAHDPEDAFSAGRSIDYNDTIYLTAGHVLYSNRSREMLRMMEDTCGRHDCLMTPCSLRMFQIVAGDDHYHPSCHENLAKAFASRGISPDRITTTFNIFMNVPVAADGRLKIEQPLSRAGNFVLFEALMDLWVGLTACSHEETNAGRCKPIEYEILCSAVGPVIDPRTIIKTGS